MTDLLLKCKKCNNLREKITINEINHLETKKAIATIYDGSQVILNCIFCDEISLVYPNQKL